MTNIKEAALPEILAGLKALAGELQDTTHSDDDGIPVLTTALASPTRPGRGMNTIGGPIPTLSTVAAHPERDLSRLESEPAKAPDVGASIRAALIASRVNALWQEARNEPLGTDLMATLERALTEALQQSI